MGKFDFARGGLRFFSKGKKQMSFTGPGFSRKYKFRIGADLTIPKGVAKHIEKHKGLYGRGVDFALGAGSAYLGTVIQEKIKKDKRRGRGKK